MTDEIRREIEKFQKKMYDLVNEKGLGHPDVIEASQMIDKLLNRLQERQREIASTKRISVDYEGGQFVVSLRQANERYVISGYDALDQALEWAHKISEQSELPVYYRNKLIKKKEQ
ncbi:aspartyl-phosphate phosphatase Spo0E family protein [Paenibacillus massiliensis]|uniref:aspartyl-phosphate phosphatase Spo0E family protein n=1 Tax=Paenibacillus massiliensis TaxID=225917 RepID=UPI0004025517|nr:aspartyl-phosphate phosphatase Spo0E family protein [Paenibacillus massiliensis]